MAHGYHHLTPEHNRLDYCQGKDAMLLLQCCFQHYTHRVKSVGLQVLQGGREIRLFYIISTDYNDILFHHIAILFEELFL
jgi:hypothetical protein